MRLSRPATPRWFQVVLAIFSLCFAASPPAFAAAFTYSDTDLLLVFRKESTTNVIFNLGSISNYLGLANGTALPVNSFDFSRVTAVFGSDLTGAKYVLMAATTPSDSLLRAWLSDADASGVASDETHSLWSKQWAKINGVGSRAAT